MSTKQLIPIGAACRYDCIHPTCIQIRTLANTPCRICGQSLGYEVWWTDAGDGDISRYQHEECARAVVRRIEDELLARARAEGRVSA